jgi:hypothetical protein
MKTLVLASIAVGVFVTLYLLSDALPPTSHNFDVVVLAGAFSGAVVLAAGLFRRQAALERRAKEYEERLRMIERVVEDAHGPIDADATVEERR